MIKQVDGDYTLDIETGASLVGPCFVLQPTCMRAQRRSMKRSAILPNLPLSCIYQSMEVY